MKPQRAAALSATSSFDEFLQSVHTYISTVYPNTKPKIVLDTKRDCITRDVFNAHLMNKTNVVISVFLENGMLFFTAQDSIRVSDQLVHDSSLRVGLFLDDGPAPHVFRHLSGFGLCLWEQPVDKFYSVQDFMVMQNAKGTALECVVARCWRKKFTPENIPADSVWNRERGRPVRVRQMRVEVWT